MNTKLTPIAKAFAPSPEQSAYFKWIVDGTGSCVLEAVAGAGKTTTLVHGLTLMVGNIFFGAFSKDIVKEISERVVNAGITNCIVNTMHAEGFANLRRAFKNIIVSADKCRDIFRGASKKYPEYKPFESIVLQLVSLAKQSGVGIISEMEERAPWEAVISHYDIETFPEHAVTDQSDLIIRLARKVLERSNATPEIVDFDDMIYMPLLIGVSFKKYDWVLIDEAQDTNVIRRLLALKILKKGGRLVAVGDRHQAIFGFTGADSNSLDLIAADTNAIRLPLSTTYRCPKAVVKVAQEYVSHIKCADTAPEGSVQHADIDQLAELATPGDAVLCRFNAPLVRYVYSFIAKGIPATIEGRDIASGLVTLARRWKSIKSAGDLLDKLKDYLEKETTKYLEKDEPRKSQVVEDKVNCLITIIDRVMKVDPKAKNIVDRVCTEIDTIFRDSGNTKTVKFSSIHKSKGREWNRVIWLTTPPSPFATKEWEMEQENNLCYVAPTRAKQELILIGVPR